MPTDKANILLIEDNPEFRQKMIKAFGHDYRIVQAPSLKSAALALNSGKYDLMLLDLSFSPDEKLEGLDRIAPFKKLYPLTPIIVITKDSKSSTNVLAIKRGADNFIRKDEFDIRAWLQLFENTITTAQARPKQEDNTTNPKSSTKFIGETKEVQKIKRTLVKLSSRPDYTVLILGETGVGKDVAARYLHEQGARAHQPFRAVNLSAVTKSVMESMLFGHQKGAFTDAKADKKGLFEQANGGVLFLDEIGEIDHEIQVKLLRFLQDKVITPVGGKDIQLDVQIVAATNRDLQSAIKNGTFRQDLYYRLGEYTVLIPPLRERQSDVELLLRHYLRKISNTDDFFISPSAWRFLVEYSWPGNVRELVNTVKKICVEREFEEIKTIEIQHLPPELQSTAQNVNSTIDNSTDSGTYSREEIKVLTDLDAFEKALREHGTKGKAAAALELNLDSLKYRIDQYFEKHPELFVNYPTINIKYKLN